MAENASSSERSQTYSLLATASKGYDSPCVAALAQEAGCKDVFVFENARPRSQLIGRYRHNREYADDSGAGIVRTLGYKNVIVRDRWMYLDNERELLEAEGCATGNPYFDPVVVFEDDLRDRVLLTGHFGDVIWGQTDETVNGDLIGGGLSGASLYESRFRIGFIHVPVPYLGASSQAQVHAITSSQEMSPWVLDRRYNRPIPRRILEERGVDRDAFGRSKKAVGVILAGSLANTLSKMTPASAQSFRDYYRAHKRSRRFVGQLCCDVIVGFYAMPIVLDALARRLRLPVGFERAHQYLRARLFKYSRSTRSASSLLPWGVSVMRDRYRSALESQGCRG